ncbi:hypothetical protein C4J81_18710 (plasmid) [Deltaproteobacteria bacterium Smac51]|nr:hypothetical protein C4J81_18710 [Deltaproteobacteria bacterium Smac51]
MATDNYISGTEAGRLILEDLALRYYQSSKGQNPDGNLSLERKAELVNSLTEPEDIVQYNNYRYVHEHLARAAIDFNSHRKNAEAAFWRMLFILEAVRRPDGRMQALRPLFAPPQKTSKTPPILATPSLFPDPLENPADDVFRGEMAEMLFALLKSWRFSLREAAAVKTAINLLAEYVKIPKIKYMAADLDDGAAPRLATLAREAALDVRPDSLARARLDRFAEMAAEITPESLKPTAQAVRRGRKALGFKTVQGGMADFYALLLDEI